MITISLFDPANEEDVRGDKGDTSPPYWPCHATTWQRHECVWLKYLGTNCEISTELINCCFILLVVLSVPMSSVINILYFIYPSFSVKPIYGGMFYMYKKVIWIGMR